MTQRDKELLLMDLCSRLPYGVKIGTAGGIGKTVDSITVRPDYIEIVIKGVYAYCQFIHKDTGEWDNDNDLDRCKPYLRSMSSMTPEEHQDWIKYSKADYDCEFKPEPTFNLEGCHLSVDWLNANHFDYRGLIQRGLALEVTPENNPYKV